MKLFEQLVFFLATKSGCISHTVPNYKAAPEKGVESIIGKASEKEEELKGQGGLNDENRQKMEFCQAVRIAMRGVLNYANNLSKKAAELAAREDDSGTC